MGASRRRARRQGHAATQDRLASRDRPLGGGVAGSREPENGWATSEIVAQLVKADEGLDSAAPGSAAGHVGLRKQHFARHVLDVMQKVEQPIVGIEHRRVQRTPVSLDK